MWWNKDGLTSGGAECAPVRVFLVPSFCVFICRLLFAIRGCGTAGLCGSFDVRRRGRCCWQWFLALTLFRRRNACHQCALLLGKLGLWRKRDIFSPLGVDCEGCAGGVPLRAGMGFLGGSGVFFCGACDVRVLMLVLKGCPVGLLLAVLRASCSLL